MWILMISLLILTFTTKKEDARMYKPCFSLTFLWPDHCR
ncbi:hypothetical protein LINPERPRIM_LOCUS38178, partial [Linum perenne]